MPPARPGGSPPVPSRYLRPPSPNWNGWATICSPSTPRPTGSTAAPRAAARAKWVLDCLEQGKPERVRELGRLRRYRSALPIMLRPDLMALDDGRFVATELDAVPGGFGVLGAISRAYQDLGFELVGGGGRHH